LLLLHAANRLIAVLQSRRLDIRMRQPKTQAGGEQKNAFVHMLNSTLSATERTLCCVLENYQTPDGVKVPECLQPFMPGISFIPFRKMFDAKGKVVDKPKADIEAAVAAAAATAGASS
jgi:seryl-tRNA synthetase